MEETIYVLVQGPAHIDPLNSDGLTVTYLDNTGKRKPNNISFSNLMEDQQTGIRVLKVVSLQLILECDRVAFERLRASGELVNYFPDTYPENYLVVDETELNQRGMNPPDPPIGRG